MNRRGFLQTILALPFVEKLLPDVVKDDPFPLGPEGNYTFWYDHTGTMIEMVAYQGPMPSKKQIEEIEKHMMRNWGIQ